MNISKVIDYVALMKKLKHEFITYSPPPIDKKPHNDVQTFCSSDSQLHLLDVCGYKGYNEPLGFASSIKANQFIDTYTMEKTKFLEQHSKMFVPSIIFSPIKKTFDKPYHTLT
jgi:hypothetical protein